jgi:hypothetical protein
VEAVTYTTTGGVNGGLLFLYSVVLYGRPTIFRMM